MTHAQLRAFHAVAREGGFTAAARWLKLTQPAISAQVRALEEAYGVTLFHRRGREVELTGTGADLFALTRKLFSLEDEASAYLSLVGGLERGTLRVGADGPYHVIRLLAAFGQRYPGLELAVTTGNSQEMREALLDYRIDVAVLAEAEGDRRFFTVPFAKHPVVVFVSRSHPWDGRLGLRLAELEGEAMIRREEGSATRMAFEAELERRGVKPRFVMEIDSREAVRETVAAGMGISVVLEPELGRDDRLGAIPITDADIHTREYVVCLEERRETRVIAAFLDIAQELSGANGDGAEREEVVS